MAPIEHHFLTADNATQALAESIAQCLSLAIHQRGRASLAVSGGRSPVPLFHRLAQCTLDWAAVRLTLVDERWVPPTSDASNERLVREHLLRGPAAAAQFVPLKTEATTPAEAVAERSAVIATLLPFDAVVLGLGEDGHTASLFPHAQHLSAALDPTRNELLCAVDPPNAPHPRLSLTLYALLQSGQLFLQKQGEAKSAVYARARSGADPLEVPFAAVLHHAADRLQVYCLD